MTCKQRATTTKPYAKKQASAIHAAANQVRNGIHTATKQQHQATMFSMQTATARAYRARPHAPCMRQKMARAVVL
eukprot:11205995-Lingulodinium_polyedra.AAC.1